MDQLGEAHRFGDHARAGQHMNVGMIAMHKCGQPRYSDGQTTSGTEARGGGVHLADVAELGERGVEKCDVLRRCAFLRPEHGCCAIGAGGGVGDVGE